jgi:hypothetical protein
MAKWPKLITDLRIQGDTAAKRLAFELMQAVGCQPLSDAEVVEVVLAYDGLTASPWPRQSDGGLTARFWRFADAVPNGRLNGILDILTAYVRELLPKHAGIEEHELIRLVYKLVLRRLEMGTVEPLTLWTWLSSYEDDFHSHDDEKAVGDWIRANDDVRRAIQRDAILGGSEKPIWHTASRLSRVSSGLTPNEGDVVALLSALDPTNRADIRWRDVLQLVPHDAQRGAAVRDAAKRFVAHDSQLRDWLDRLAEPRVPEWKIEQEAKTRQRAAKRAVQFAEHRRDFVANVQKVQTGEFRYIYPLAQAYLKLFHDIGDDCAPHERVARWLGQDIAVAAHQGFEAFLTREPARPSAKRIAVSGANGRSWNAGLVIVAALAERVRIYAEPFVDLPDERLMAGVFELWRSRIDDHAGLPNLCELIEIELRHRAAWEAALRLYIVPQLKRRLVHVDGLYSLMRSENDAALAVSLAIEWLGSCHDMAASPESEMIDRVVHSPRRSELRAFGDLRRGKLDDERRRNWDAVQVLVDFEAAAARLGDPAEPELLWNVRARAGDRRRDERGSAAMRPDQLAWIVASFRKLWPAQGRPSGVTSGDTNAWDASDYLFSQVSLLGDHTSDEAVAAIKALLDAPQDGYTDHVRAVAAEQRQKRVEKTYLTPTLGQIRSILDAGPPVDTADLQAVTLEALDTTQRLLRGSDVDWYRGFFREDGRHKDEELCRDEIIKMLRTIDNSLEYIPEAHVADEKRIDIVAHAHKQLILPIEIKGQWHPELWIAADKQLDHRYVNDWRAERGIYLVLWFGEDTVIPNAPDGRSKPKTPAELREALHAMSKAAVAGRVNVVVLDITRPSAS